MVRFKNRYFVLEIRPNGMSEIQSYPIKDTDIYHAVVRFVEQIHGEFGAAAIRTGLNVKYCNQWTKVAIVRSRHGPHRLVGSALPFISFIDNKQVRVHSLYTGATLIKCFLFLKKYQQGKIMQVLQNCKNDEEKRLISSNLSNIRCGKE
nr:EOG090X0GYO [Leptodora kindtii]